MATLLSLFTDEEMSGFARRSRSNLKVNYNYNCRWCHGCPLYGLCDDSECANRPQSNPMFWSTLNRMAPYATFDSETESCAAYVPTRFPSLGAFINFKKMHGWL